MEWKEVEGIVQSKNHTSIYKVIDETVQALCEWCNAPIINEMNIGHLCAYQMTEDTVLNAQGWLFCTCCDACRQECHNGLFENDENSEQE